MSVFADSFLHKLHVKNKRKKQENDTKKRMRRKKKTRERSMRKRRRAKEEDDFLSVRLIPGRTNTYQAVLTPACPLYPAPPSPRRLLHECVRVVFGGDACYPICNIRIGLFLEYLGYSRDSRLTLTSTFSLIFVRKNKGV